MESVNVTVKNILLFLIIVPESSLTKEHNCVVHEEQNATLS